MKRIGTPEEVAQTILFVASDKAAFITGASIAVDGAENWHADSVRLVNRLPIEKDRGGRSA